MPTEIERKFLVKDNSYQGLARPILIRQGFLCNTAERVVRVRIMDKQAFLTIKGSSVGISRSEFEYPVPLDDARYMLARLCTSPLIEKLRYRISFGGFTWEVDEFLEENAGLVVAEIELERENQAFTKPSWIGDEVTGDPRYYNSSLVRNPFRSWNS